MFDVEYYEKEDGTFPAEEFILSLDSKMNGFVKKTQKTPDNEIALAKKYRKDYLERNKE